MINKPYEKVTIELKENFNLNEIKNILSNDGEAVINLIIKDKNKKISYSLQNNRKFDLKHIRALREYVAKITFRVLIF